MQRLHPLSALSKTIQGGASGFAILVLAVPFLSDRLEFVDSSWLFVLAPLGFAVGLGYGVAWYYRFTYELTAETVDIDSGVFARQSREIPYHRIQNVDIRQDLIQRLLGLAVVSIETAGGGDTEATLQFVTEDEAERIQTEIRRLTAESGTDRDEAEPTSSAAAEPSSADSAEPGAAVHGADRTLLFSLEPRELILYAATTIRWSAAILPVFLLAFVSDGSGGSLLSVPDVSTVALLALAVVPWALATYVLSALFTIGRYYGFRLERAGNDFAYERGLIERYSGSIPVEKVQSVTVTDNPLQRLLGYAGLWVETAGYGPESQSTSQATVPFADESRIYRFLEGITRLERPEFSDHPAVARRRYLARYSILAALVVAVAFGIAQFTALERWYLAAVAFLAVPPAAHLKWTNMQYHVGDDHLVIRRGFWRRRTTVIPYYRIQTVSTRRSLFQRRLGLASVVVDTASSRTFFWATPTIDDIQLEDAREIHRGGRERLQRALGERARDDDLGLSAEIA